MLQIKAGKVLLINSEVLIHRLALLGEQHCILSVLRVVNTSLPYWELHSTSSTFWLYIGIYVTDIPIVGSNENFSVYNAHMREVHLHAKITETSLHARC